MFCFLDLLVTLKCWFEVLFIGFVLKALSNSLKLPSWYMIILFLLFIDYACFYNSSSRLNIVCYVLVFCDSVLLLPLHSSSSLIISGGSAISIYCPLNWDSLYYVSRSSLNTLWITYSFGNSSWNVPWPMFFAILTSLYLFWSSFLEDCFG